MGGSGGNQGGAPSPGWRQVMQHGINPGGMTQSSGQTGAAGPQGQFGGGGMAPGGPKMDALGIGGMEWSPTGAAGTMFDPAMGMAPGEIGSLGAIGSPSGGAPNVGGLGMGIQNYIRNLNPMSSGQINPASYNPGSFPADAAEGNGPTGAQITQGILSGSGMNQGGITTPGTGLRAGAMPMMGSPSEPMQAPQGISPIGVPPSEPMQAPQGISPISAQGGFGQPPPIGGFPGQPGQGGGGGFAGGGGGGQGFGLPSNPFMSNMLNSPYWQAQFAKNPEQTKAAFSPPAFNQAQQFYPNNGQQTTMQALQALMGGNKTTQPVAHNQLPMPIS